LKFVLLVQLTKSLKGSSDLFFRILRSLVSKNKKKFSQIITPEKSSCKTTYPLQIDFLLTNSDSMTMCSISQKSFISLLFFSSLMWEKAKTKYRITYYYRLDDRNTCCNYSTYWYKTYKIEDFWPSEPANVVVQCVAQFQ
jgi:hypothetical protein